MILGYCGMKTREEGAARPTSRLEYKGFGRRRRAESDGKLKGTQEGARAPNTLLDVLAQVAECKNCGSYKAKMRSKKADAELQFETRRWHHQTTRLSAHLKYLGFAEEKEKPLEKPD